MRTITILLSVLVISSRAMSSLMTNCARNLKELNDLTSYCNQFAFDVYQELRTESENIIVSPISICITLAVLYQGAKGDTASEIAKVLHYPTNKDMRSISSLKVFKYLITRLRGPELQIATSLFPEKTACLIREFQDNSNKYFLTNVEGKDFINDPEGSRLDINKWAEINTNYKIKDLLPEGSVDRNTKLVVVNAIHFKADWLYMFNKNDTKMMPFYITANETKDVEIMHQYNKNYPYMENQEIDAKIIEMPYNISGNSSSNISSNISMILVCPNKVDGLEKVENELKNVNISEFLSGLSMTEVNVMLPKFKIEETIPLINPLQNLGMKTAFTDLSDFSGITSNYSLKISAILQKAFIEVDEKGTEAAAATGAVVTTTAVRIIPDVNCNRPFLSFLLRKKPLTILFIARYRGDN